MSFYDQFIAAKNASTNLALLSTEQKNTLLLAFADALENHADEIVLENKKDIEAAPEGPMVDRLLLTKERVEAIANDVRNVASLEDEVGKIVSETERPNGLLISRIRVPLGVVGIIYESRPNVTVDAAVLALKSGNAVVLKGGKEAIHSNRAFVQVMKAVLKGQGVSSDAIQFLDTTGREATAEMLTARGLVDVVIPRGGKGLIRFVVENAKVPVIETGASVVHTFVDKDVDIDLAVDIILNEKTRRVSVCNALDTILLHKDVANVFLKKLGDSLVEFSKESSTPLVKIHAKETVLSKISDYPSEAKIALAKEDYETEWLDYEISIRIVADIDEALEHIRTYSLGHSESICSTNSEHIETFLNQVDAACVYANASTCFSDGAQFGLGAEIGISTQKVHVRGPFALEGLTTKKWIIRGNGQTRL